MAIRDQLDTQEIPALVARLEKRADMVRLDHLVLQDHQGLPEKSLTVTTLLHSQLYSVCIFIYSFPVGCRIFYLKEARS